MKMLRKSTHLKILDDIDQDGSENTDILYLWRLRRRMEIAQENQNSSPPRVISETIWL